MSNTINLSTLGLGSGLNDTSIIASLVSVQQQPLTAMQTLQTNVQSASQTVSSFSSLLSSLQTATNALSDPTQYASYTASSSDPSVVATTTSSATPGSYTVNVTALAKAQITYGTPHSSNTAGLGFTGSLDLTVGNNPVPFNVPVQPGDSLATIAAHITAKGAGVTASVVFDGSQYRLQLQGNATGKANAVTFQENGFSMGLTNETNYQSAQDAAATINNIPVTSATNQISGAIPGVTLAVTALSVSPATVNVASNPTAIAQNVSAFVTAYNAVVAAGHAATGYGTTKATNSLLTGDRGIGSALRSLSSLVTADVPGADSTFPNLASVGVTLNNDGSLSLNSTTLSSAIASDPVGVSQLFVTNTATGSTGVMGAMSTAITAVVSGAGSPLKAEIQSYTTRIQSLTKQETALQARITKYQTQLQTEFTAMEQTVQSAKTDYGNLGGTGTFV